MISCPTKYFPGGAAMFASIRKNYNHTIFASYGGYITQAVINNFAPRRNLSCVT